MPPKGDKGKGKASSSTTTKGKKSFKPWKTKMGFTLLSQQEKDLFDSLITRAIVPTRFMSVTTLTKLGLHDDCKWLLDRVGAYDLFVQARPTYEALTYEFLCTFQWTGLILRFRLRDKEKEVNLATFFRKFNIQVTDENIHDEELCLNRFWNQLTGEREYKLRTAKASNIAHPAFRYLHRVLAHSIFARNESDGTVRSDELWAMWCMANQKPWDLMTYIVNHWQAVQVGKVTRGAICIGGYVTLLAEHVNCDLSPFEPVPGSISDDLRTCAMIRIAKRVGKNEYHHTVKGRLSPIILPRADISVQDRDHWRLLHIPDVPLIEGGHDANEEEEGGPSHHHEDIHMEDVHGEEEEQHHDAHEEEQHFQPHQEEQQPDPYGYDASDFHADIWYELNSLRSDFTATRQDVREMKDSVEEMRRMQIQMLGLLQRPRSPPPS